jgi:cytochrome c biogenesis protein CcmG/thiol:disulfide interchange protein DsbE
MGSVAPADSVAPRRTRQWPRVGATLVVVIGASVAMMHLWRDGPPGALEAGPVDSALVGQPAPGFALEDLAGGDTTVVVADRAGRPVVVNFWASWCVPCRTEMPALEAVHQRFAGRVAFVGVDHGDQRDPARELVAATGVTYPMGFDPNGTVAVDYGLVGLPSTVVVGSDGRVESVYLGAVDSDRLGAALASLVADGDEPTCSAPISPSGVRWSARR